MEKIALGIIPTIVATAQVAFCVGCEAGALLIGS